MSPKKVKPFLYMLLAVSFLYAAPAALLYLAALKQTLFSSGGRTTIRQSYSMLLDQTGEAFFGLLFMGLIGAWVLTIALGSQIKLPSKAKKAASSPSVDFIDNKIFSAFGAFMKANFILAGFCFLFTISQVGGHIHCNDADCYITYRGEFVRTISTQQALEYQEKLENTGTYFVSSLVLVATGYLFLVCLSFVLRLNQMENSLQCGEKR